jgi:hypothetical protein
VLERSKKVLDKEEFGLVDAKGVIRDLSLVRERCALNFTEEGELETVNAWAIDAWCRLKHQLPP